MRDAAEFGKIGTVLRRGVHARVGREKSDAEKDEWVYDASKTPSYGTDTLGDFFKKVSVEGLAGQELGDQAVFK